MNEEYKKRYNHKDDHITIQKLGELLRHPPKNAKINKIATDPTTKAMNIVKLMVTQLVIETTIY